MKQQASALQTFIVSVSYHCFWLKWCSLYCVSLAVLLSSTALDDASSEFQLVALFTFSWVMIVVFFWYKSLSVLKILKNQKRLPRISLCFVRMIFLWTEKWKQSHHSFIGSVSESSSLLTWIICVVKKITERLNISLYQTLLIHLLLSSWVTLTAA